MGNKEISYISLRMKMYSRDWPSTSSAHLQAWKENFFNSICKNSKICNISLWIWLRDSIPQNWKKHANADVLSRLPLQNSEKEVDNEEPINVFHVEQIENLPVSNKEIQIETRKDKTLALVHDFVLNGWPHAYKNGELAPYYARRDELTMSQWCLMWGIRVVIPTKLCSQVLDEMHDGHLGVVKMKSFARSRVWWPGIDKDLESLAKKVWRLATKSQYATRSSTHSMGLAFSTWERIHVDFAGPFPGSMFIIVVDAMSKWPEVIQMSKTTSHIPSKSCERSLQEMEYHHVL